MSEINPYSPPKSEVGLDQKTKPNDLIGKILIGISSVIGIFFGLIFSFPLFAEIRPESGLIRISVLLFIFIVLALIGVFGRKWFSKRRSYFSRTIIGLILSFVGFAYCLLLLIWLMG